MRCESLITILKEGTPWRITQHKRFVPYGTHLNPTFGGTSFMLGTLYAIGFGVQIYKNKGSYKWRVHEAS